MTPFNVHLIGLNLNEDEAKKAAEETYERLMRSGITVLYDDREEVSAGIKFNDADLIGIPRQVIVSKKLVAEDKVEVKSRKDGASETVDLSTLDRMIKS